MSEIKDSNQINSTADDIKINSEDKEHLLTEQTKLPNIEESKYSRILRKALRRIEERKPKDIGSIFDTKRKIEKKKRNHEINNTFNNEINIKNNREKDKYNVFLKEDNLIKDLMLQFEEKNTKDTIPKLKRKKMAFNRLYDITDKSNKKIINLKKSKNLYSLEKYQEKMVKAIHANSIEQNEIMNLIQNLNNLRYESNKVQALPPINVKMIKAHIINNKKKESRKKTMKEIMNNNTQPLDEFEKEEKMIRYNKTSKSLQKVKRNKNFDMLPAYIRDIFTTKLNYHS